MLPLHQKTYRGGIISNNSIKWALLILKSSYSFCLPLFRNQNLKTRPSCWHSWVKVLFLFDAGVIEVIGCMEKLNQKSTCVCVCMTERERDWCWSTCWLLAINSFAVLEILSKSRAAAKCTSLQNYRENEKCYEYACICQCVCVMLWLNNNIKKYV